MTQASNKSSICVIGSGSGAHVTAFRSSQIGCYVKLYARDARFTRQMNENGNRLRATGAFSGIVHLDVVTNYLPEALLHSSLILIVVTSNAHRAIARQLAGIVRPEQTVVLMPGRTGGALVFRNELLRSGHALHSMPAVLETQSLFCACRLIGPGHVEVISKKPEIQVSGFGAKSNSNALLLLEEVIGRLKVESTTLITSLGNMGAILHPAPVLLNAGWIESRRQFFGHYYEAISPTVAGFIERMDKERAAIASVFNIPTESLKQWHERNYGVKGSNLYETLQMNSAYASLDAPNALSHRYVTEDVATGLVPMTEIASVVGVDTPCMNIVVELANALLERDFRAEGINKSVFGIEELALSEIEMLFRTGQTTCADSDSEQRN
jgi:opine dehydrogenase